MPNAFHKIPNHSSAPVPAPGKDGSGGLIGLFDSGVGGLSVLRAVARALPHHNLVYFADQKYCPYGPRDPAEIRALSERISRFLIARGCAVVVVACNTASAAALYALRSTFPQTVFVGMEPALKPAASTSRSRQVAVLATRGTFAGELFTHTRDEYAQDVEVLTVYPHDWVERVERGDIDSAETFASVRQVIEPLLERDVDAIALGCTHYPFLAPVISRIAPGRATVIDPSNAVARQTARHVHSLALPVTAAPVPDFYTSGDPVEFTRVLRLLLNIPAPRVFSSDI